MINRGLFKRNVNPRIVAVIILIVLGGVQWWWWESLVAKRSGRSGGGRMQQGRPPERTPLLIEGREDVYIDTFAGTPEPGYVDGPGHRARFDGPSGLAMDRDGAVLVADTRNHRIRRVDSRGVTTTVAGSEAGFRDGSAAEALFSAPSGIRAEPGGAMLIFDSGNRRIRRLAGGIVTTVAEFPDAAVAAKKFFSGERISGLKVIPPPGESDPGLELKALHGARILRTPGRTFAVDDGNNALFILREDGAEVVAGIFTPAQRIEGWMDGKGNESRIGRIGGLAAADSQTVYLADTTNNAIRKVTFGEGG